MRVILLLHRFLTTKRLAYAKLLGGILWLGWLVSIFFGPGNRDLYGQLLAPDYLSFYTGGKMLVQGQYDHLYDFDLQWNLQQQLIGEDWTDFEPFLNPPFFALFSAPLAQLPYEWSFAVWTLLGLLALWASLRLLGAQHPGRAFIWSLTWFPIFATISFGQNSLLSLLLFSLVYRLWRRERPGTAGLVASLLLFKPQWLPGIGLLWLLEWRHDGRALAGLALGGATLGLVSLWQLPEATRTYIQVSREFLPHFQTQPGYPLYHLHTVRGFWLLLLPQHSDWADALFLVSSALALLGFIYFWRRYRTRQPLLFAGLICLTLWISPHALIYDWAVLLIPAVLLWYHAPELRDGWKILYAVIWLATLVSGPLTNIQLQWLPAAIQISVPVLLLVLYVTCRWLQDSSSLVSLVSQPFTEDSSGARQSKILT